MAISKVWWKSPKTDGYTAPYWAMAYTQCTDVNSDIVQPGQASNHTLITQFEKKRLMITHIEFAVAVSASIRENQ